MMIRRRRLRRFHARRSEGNKHQLDVTKSFAFRRGLETQCASFNSTGGVNRSRTPVDIDALHSAQPVRRFSQLPRSGRCIHGQFQSGLVVSDIQLYGDFNSSHLRLIVVLPYRCRIKSPFASTRINASPCTQLTWML